MKQKCRNDCIGAGEFPKKIRNRPGLARVGYRVGTYSDFLDDIIGRLNRNKVLNGWTHRESDDPGIALLEGASILCDILTFYQELYANEAFLRTAQWRQSISDLVRLMGYRLSPGVGGEGAFAFEVEGDRPVMIPPGLPLKAQVEGLEGQAEFETAKGATAYPFLGRFSLYRPLKEQNVVNGTSGFFISHPDQYLEPVEIGEGDRLLIGDPDPQTDPKRIDNAEVVIVDRVERLHGTAIIRIKGGLTKRDTNVDEVVGFKLGRSFRHFGHNSPGKVVKLDSGGASSIDISFSRILDVKTLSEEDDTSITSRRIVDPELQAIEFPLESEISDLASGNVILIQGGFGCQRTDLSTEKTVIKRKIGAIRPISMTWGAVSGPATMLSLSENIAPNYNGSSYIWTDIRTLQFHEVTSPMLTLKAEKMKTDSKEGQKLFFFGTGPEVSALDGRRLFFETPGKEGYYAAVASVDLFDGTFPERPMLRGITLNRSVDYENFPNKDPFVTVYGNLVEATQGKTERETVLGNGDTRHSFQTFKLPKSPLTYLNAPGRTPPEAPELKVYVNGILWRMAPSFFGCGPDEEVYIVREDDDGTSWVQFGDGKTGARLPSGKGNVTALYRTGIAAHGALKEDTTVQAVGRLKRLDKVFLPGVVSGGDVRETGENAREAAPGKIQSLDRLVSLADFESEALGIPGVTRALASWGISSGTPAIILTLLMETGREREFDKVSEIITRYNSCRGADRHTVIAKRGKVEYVRLSVDFACDPRQREEDVRSAIKDALGVSGAGKDTDQGLFSTRSRGFGQGEYATRIAGTVQNVSGVIWCSVREFSSLGEAEDPSEIEFPETGTLNDIVPCDSLHMLGLHAGHLRLNAIARPAKEVC